MITAYFNGTVTSEPSLDHSYDGENFYSFRLATERTSKVVDVVDCIVPECELNNLHLGDNCKVLGDIRTRNHFEAKSNKTRLIVYCFVRQIDEYAGVDSNFIKGDGYICNAPTYRQTPFGREISDFLLASQRERGHKSDYIPSITWGRNAKRISEVEIGKHISCEGRLQSRTYTKTYEDGSVEDRIAFEMSVSKFEIIE